MAAVTQEFRAVGDEQIARAYEKLAKHAAKLEEENQRLRQSTKQGAEEAERARQKAIRQLEEEVRRTQDLKRARQELIRTTDFVLVSGGGGGMIPRRPDINYTTASAGGGAMIVRPNWSPIRPSGAWANWEQVDDRARNPNALSRSVDFTMQGHPGAPPNVRLANPFGGLMTGAVGQIAQMAAAWVSVETAIRAVNYQQELMHRRMSDSAEAQRSLARGQAEIVLNTFGGTAGERQQLFAAAEQISAKTGVSQSLVAQNLGRQAGRGAGLSTNSIIAAQEMAARLGRHTPEQIEPLATAIQQTMRIGGLGVEDAASLIQSAGAAAFIGEPWQQARFLQQVLSSGVASVPNPTAKSLEEILELGGYITQRVGEERGEAGRTSSIALLAQFQEFREGRGAWATTGAYGRKMMHPVKGAPTDPKDMIEWLQKNPRQARRFLDKATFERMFEEPWRNLILGKSPEDMRLYAETQALVGVNRGGLAEQLAAIESATDPLRTASSAERSEAAKVNFDAGATIQARRKEAYDIREKWLSATYRYGGMPGFLDYSLRQAGDVLGVGEIEDRALSSLRTRRIELGRRGAGTPFPTAAPLEGERLNMAQALDAQIKRLEEIRDEIKQLNANTPGAGPAMNAQRGTSRER